MCVRAKNISINYSALKKDLVTQTGRLGDCVPVAVRSVYRFFGINRPFTYKEFIKAGLRVGGGVSAVDNFYKNESLGLILDIHEIKGKADFIEKIKSARENNHPVIIGQPVHAYTIIPHKIAKEVTHARFDIETGKKLKGTIIRHIKFFRFYLNKNSEPINLGVGCVRKGSKNLVVCFNSRFKDSEKDIAYNYREEDIKLVEIESVWREFQEGKEDRFYEVKGVKFSLEQLKTPGYEWGSTKREHKKNWSPRRIEAKYWYRKYFDYFNRYLNCAFIYKIEESDSDCEIIRKLGKSKEYYDMAAERLKLLEKDCFSVYGIGAELRKDFNKNLPALYEKKEIVEYLKH
ncbi:MAG: hypothetical protein AABY22_33175 [Nanoarchaeota archaeon]|mgnify:CR=1 FL=1